MHIDKLVNFTPIASFLGCAFIYFFYKWHWKKYAIFAKLSPEMQAMTVIRLVSTVHATLTTILPVYILLTDEELWKNKVYYKSPMITFTLSLTIGYMVFDFLYMYAYRHIGELPNQYIVHHGGSILAFSACLIWGWFPFVALLRLSSELSTPFCNVKWGLSKVLKNKDSKLYSFITWTVVISYLLCRILTIIPNWIVYYDMTRQPIWADIFIGFKILLICATFSLDCLNIHWYSLVLKSFKKHLEIRSDLRKSKNKPNLNGFEHKSPGQKIGEHLTRSNATKHEKNI